MWAMPLLDRIQKDMVDAMKAKDEARLGAIRMIKAALKKVEVDSMKPLTEATEMQVMNTLIKQRRESADMFRKGSRPELADKEEAELKLIEAYRQQYGADFISVMPTNLYGPGDNYHPEHSHVPAALIRRIHEAKIAVAPTVTVDGSVYTMFAQDSLRIGLSVALMTCICMTAC